MKIKLDEFIKYEVNKRELFIRHYTEKINELNLGMFNEFKEKLSPYNDVLEKLNKLQGKEQEEFLKTKEVQEALAIISDAEKMKDKVVLPEFDEEFLISNLTISKEELKQYLYN